MSRRLFTHMSLSDLMSHQNIPVGDGIEMLEEAFCNDPELLDFIVRSFKKSPDSNGQDPTPEMYIRNLISLLEYIIQNALLDSYSLSQKYALFWNASSLSLTVQQLIGELKSETLTGTEQLKWRSKFVGHDLKRIMGLYSTDLTTSNLRRVIGGVREMQRLETKKILTPEERQHLDMLEAKIKLLEDVFRELSESSLLLDLLEEVSDFDVQACIDKNFGIVIRELQSSSSVNNGKTVIQPNIQSINAINLNQHDLLLSFRELIRVVSNRGKAESILVVTEISDSQQDLLIRVSSINPGGHIDPNSRDYIDAIRDVIPNLTQLKKSGNPPPNVNTDSIFGIAILLDSIGCRFSIPESPIRLPGEKPLESQGTTTLHEPDKASLTIDIAIPLDTISLVLKES